MADAKLNTRITIGSNEFPVRFSYLNAHEAKEVEREDDDGKKTIEKLFSTQVIIDKKDTATKAAIDKLVDAVAKDYFGGKVPALLKLPLRDGDLEADEKGDAVKGAWFFNCSSKHKPSVVGTAKDEFTGKLAALDASEIKSGDYGRISLNFFGFKGKQKGVAVGLGNIQKLKDGEALGSQRSADDDFGDLEDGFND